MLFVGKHTEKILEHLPDKFLLIDDGALIDALDFPKHHKVTRLDLSIHSLNPLKDINYRKATDFLDLLNAIFPEGENTLTKGQADDVLLTALLSKPKSLYKLIPKGKEPGHLEARRKIHRLLLSPVLEPFLTRPTNLSLQGTVLARLNRAELGSFDAFVLANVLISQYEGTVVVPDFGFYGCPFHRELVLQGRLIAGVRYLDEAKDLKNILLLMDKRASGCTHADAEVLAKYENIAKGTNAYKEFIEDCVGG